MSSVPECALVLIARYEVAGCRTRRQLMANLNMIIGQQTDERALLIMKTRVSNEIHLSSRCSSFYLAAASDSHERDENVIFTEFLNLSKTSVRHVGHEICSAGLRD